jgi:hypothetical protein
MVSRKELFEAIKADYNNLHPDMINLVLDLHETDSQYIEGILKEEKKKCKVIPRPKRQINLQELDLLTELFKEKEKDILKNSFATIISDEITEEK